jgi:hypothetical protein
MGGRGDEKYINPTLLSSDIFVNVNENKNENELDNENGIENYKLITE